MHNLWHACLRRLEQEVPAQQFSTWIRPLSPESSAADSGTLVLTAPNRFVLELVRERFLARIVRLAAELGGGEIEVKLSLAPVLAADAAPLSPAPAGHRPAPVTPDPPAADSVPSAGGLLGGDHHDGHDHGHGHSGDHGHNDG